MRTRRTEVRRVGVLVALVVLLVSWARAADVTLADGDDLQRAIDAAVGGDTLRLGTGTYRGFALKNRHFTAERPLVIKAAPGARPVIRGTGYRGFLARIDHASYVVFDGLTFEQANQPIYAVAIEHFIFVNLEIHDTGQEAIHIRGTSRYVDIRNCTIHDTGHTKPQWAEGIYIGTGQPPFENVEHVWIEGNHIHHTGNSEAINLKSRTYHVTIRGNRVHDIAPGTDTQHNEAAISCEAADLSFRPGVDPDLWFEENEISDVRFGRWANGIKVSTAGGRFLRNTIRDCAQFGIAFNAHGNGPGVFPAWLVGNTIERCSAGAVSESILPQATTNPGSNPNRPQTWYHADAPPGA